MSSLVLCIAMEEFHPTRDCSVRTDEWTSMKRELTIHGSALQRGQMHLLDVDDSFSCFSSSSASSLKRSTDRQGRFHWTRLLLVEGFCQVKGSVNRRDLSLSVCMSISEGAVGSHRNDSNDLMIWKPTRGFLPKDRWSLTLMFMGGT